MINHPNDDTGALLELVEKYAGRRRSHPRVSVQDPEQGHGGQARRDHERRKGCARRVRKRPKRQPSARLGPAGRHDPAGISPSRALAAACTASSSRTVRPTSPGSPLALWTIWLDLWAQAGCSRAWLAGSDGRSTSGCSVFAFCSWGAAGPTSDSTGPRIHNIL